MSDDTHTLNRMGLVSETLRWLAQYGYKGQSSPVGHDPVTLSFSRDDECVKLATMGETLIWDGASVRVKSDE